MAAGNAAHGGFLDYAKNLQPVLDYTANLQPTAEQAVAAIDQFDTSMIKVDKGTTDASTAVQQFGVSVNDSEGNIVSLTDLLKELAVQYEDVAKAADDAATAEGNASSAGSGGGGSGKGGSSAYNVYIDPTTPQGAALQPIL